MPRTKTSWENKDSAELASEPIVSDKIRPSATVSVSSSSLESAAAATAALPNVFGGLDQFDIGDFTNDHFPSLAVSDVYPSHPGASHTGAAAVSSTNHVNDSRSSSSSPPDAAEEVSSQQQTNTVPEFLYQLTKLLTDDNRDVIEWSHGQIEVHNPHKLESDVLKKYFRHSKYASFQRQLNYFGFRKLAGKGKMAPCSYTNDHTTPDIRSLLAIKRKASAPRDRSASAKRERLSNVAAAAASSGVSEIDSTVNPVLASILQKANSSKRARPSGDGSSNHALGFKLAKKGGVKHQLNGYLKNTGKNSEQASLAQAAVGKGIRHGFCAASTGTGNADDVKSKSATSVGSGMTFLDPPQLGMSVESSLSQLASNYLKAQGSDQSVSIPDETRSSEPSAHSSSFLTRESSLVDLAMLPTLPLPEEKKEIESETKADHFTFVDFPNGENSFS